MKMEKIVLLIPFPSSNSRRVSPFSVMNIKEILNKQKILYKTLPLALDVKSGSASSKLGVLKAIIVGLLRI